MKILQMTLSCILIPLEQAINFLMKFSKISMMYLLFISLKEQSDSSSRYFNGKLILVYGPQVLSCQINTSLMIPKAQAPIVIKFVNNQQLSNASHIESHAARTNLHAASLHSYRCLKYRMLPSRSLQSYPYSDKCLAINSCSNYHRILAIF